MIGSTYTKISPALPGIFISLRRNHQTALHHPDAYPFVDLESGLLQPVKKGADLFN